MIIKQKLHNLILDFLFIGMAVVSFYPLFKLGHLPQGWDLQFHLNRIQEIYSNLANGNFFYNENIFSFKKIGSAINAFYPSIFLYPFAIFRFIIKNPVHSYYVTIILYTYASYKISFTVMYKFSKSNRQALIFSIVYNTSSYFILQSTSRADLGEFFALIFLPLLFFGTYEVLFQNYEYWYLFALGWSAVLYAHLLTAMLSAFLWVLISILHVRKVKQHMSTERILSIMQGVILTLFMSVFLLVSIFQKSIANNIAPPATVDDMTDNALNVSNLFNKSIENAVPTTLNDVNIGIILIVAFIFCAINLKKLSNVYKEAYFVGVFTLWMSTNLFPWHTLRNSGVNIIQFPWRFMSFAVLLLILCFSKLLADMEIKKIVLFVPLVLFPLTTIYHDVQQYKDVFPILTSTQNYNKMASNASCNDYMPKASIKYADSIKGHKVIIDNNEQLFNASKIISGPQMVTYNIHMTKGSLDLPLLNYKDTHVYVDGRLKTSVMSKRGTIQLNNVKVNEKIVVKYVYPTWKKVLFFVSLAAVTCDLYIVFLNVYKKHSN